MANEFVTRTGLIVSGSTFLPAVTTASKGYILSFDDTTKQVYYMSTSSVTVTVPGSDTQIIYNNGGAFGAASNFVFSGSNVGIGTTTPAYKLHVSSSNNNDGIAVHYPANNSSQYPFYVGDNSNGVYARLNATEFEFKRNGAGSTIKTVGSSNNLVLESANNLVFNANGATTQMYVSSSGFVGVGATSPESYETFSVRKQWSRFSQPTSTDYTLIEVSNTTNTTRLGVENSSGGSLTGGSSPYAAVVASTGNRALQLSTSGSVVMTITGSNVGIGTTSPSEKLSVNGFSYAYGAQNVSGFKYENTTVGHVIIMNANDSYAQIYTPGATPLMLGTNNTSRVYITSAGNVGIGTTNPSEILDVQKAGTVAVRVYNTSSTADAYFNAKNSTGDAFFGINATGQYLYTSNNIPILFYNSGSERMRITNAGDVGIGTTSPGSRLQVVNTSSPYQISVKSDTSKVWSMGVGISGYYQEWFLLNDGSTDIIRINAGYTEVTNDLYVSADLGVGKSPSNATLDVSGSVLISGSLTVSGSSTFTNIGPAVFTGSITQNASTASFGGVVGIGTTSPSGKLQVGTYGTVGAPTYSTANGDGLIFDFFNSGDPYTRFGRIVSSAGDTSEARLSFFTKASSANPTEKVTILGNGNVGIGTTSPDTPLVVQGGAMGTGGWNRTATLSATYPGLIFNSNGTKWGGMAYDYSAAMRFWVNANNNDIFAGTLALSILNNGNVGIGNSDPTYKLDVNGTGRFVGNSGAPALQIIDGGSTFGVLGISGSQAGDVNWLLMSGYPSAGNFTIRQSDTVNALVIQKTTGAATFSAGVTAASFTGSFSGSVSAPGSTTQIVYNSGGALAASPNFVFSGSRVGIGTAGPYSEVDIRGNVYTSGYTVGFDINPVSNYAYRLTNDSGNSFVNIQGGNFGIGTTSPNRTLTVNGIFGVASGDTNVPELVLSADGTATYISSTYKGTSSYVPLWLETNGSPRVAITTAGNVGIGTTSPSTLLDVRGEVSVAYSATYGLRFYNDARNNWSFIGNSVSGSSSANLRFGDATGEVMRITGGNVGIGITNPAYKLDVNGQSRIAGQLILSGVGTSEVYTADASGLYLTAGTAAGMYLQSDGTFYFRKASNPYTEYMRIAGTGDVQIGTTAYAGIGGSGYLMVKNVIGLVPDNTASTNNRNWAIQANGQFNGSLDFVTSAASASFPNDAYRVSFTRTGGVVASSFTGSFSGSVSAPGSTTQIVYNSGGALAADSGFVYSGSRVGIGTANPSQSLSVNGAIESLGDSFSEGGQLILRGTTYRYNVDNYNGQALRFFREDDATLDGGTVLMYVSASGNVGIGTTTPTYLLDVNGTARFLGNAATSPASIFNNTTGASGTAQYYSEYTVGATTIGRIFRGNGASGVVGNGLNIDNYDGFQIRANQLGGSGGTINLLGGNVGINTTSPSAKLDVYRALQTDTITRANAAAYIWGADIGLAIGQYASGPYGTWLQSLKYDNNNSFPLSLNPSGGNVGIGTSNPTAKLFIEGNDIVLNTEGSAQGKSLYFRYSDGANVQSDSYLKFSTGGSPTEKMRITSTGDVGIGTTSPGAKLDVYGVASSDTVPGLRVLGNDWGSVSNAMVRFDGGPASDGNILLLKSQNNNRSDSEIFEIQNSGSNTVFVVKGTGNVGIGTSNPSYNLHVSSSGYYGGNLTVEGTITAQKLNVQQITSSVVYSSGSNIFGNSLSNTQTFTGSVNITGSVNLGTGTVIYGDTTTPSLTLDQTTGTYLKYSTNSEVALLGSLAHLKAANAVALMTGTTAHLYVSSSGNVGIGTTSPYAPLNVKVTGLPPTSGQQGYFGNVVLQGDSGYYNRLRFDTNGTGSWGVAVNPDRKFVISRLDSSFVGTPDDSNFVIDTSGSVGIGTTSPGAPLDVNGSLNSGKSIIRVTNSDTANYITLGAGIPGVSNAGMNFTLDGSSKMVISAGGNVGIGTTSPAQKLDVAGGDIILSSNATYIRSKDASGNTPRMFGINPSNDTYIGPIDSYAGGAVFYGVSANVASQTFYTGATARLHIASGGNVGIGTTSPTYALDINNTGASTARVRVLANTNYALLQAQNSSGVLYLGVDDSSGSGFSSGAYSRLIWSSGNYPLIFAANDVERLRITSTGYVGIGTTNPTQYSSLFPAQLAVNASSTADGIFSTTDNSSAAELVLFKKNPSNDFGSLLIQHSGSTGRAIELNYGVNMSTGLGGSTSYFVNTNGSGYYAGNVGIGTTSPNTKLNIQEINSGTEGLIITNWNSVNTLLLGSDSSTGGGKITLRTNGGTSNVFISSYGISYFNGGNVGIGTDSPTAKLQVKGDGGSTGITFQTTDSSNNQNFWVLDGGRAGTQYYPFMIAHSSSVTPTGQPYLQVATSVLYVSQSGAVGIGTSTPAVKLDVLGLTNTSIFNIRQSSGLLTQIESDNGYANLFLYQAGGNAQIGLVSNGSSYFNGGNVGIGTSSPNNILHLYTNYAGSSNSGSAITITSDGSGGDNGWIGVNKGTGNGLTFGIENRDIIFQTDNTTAFNGTERMRITTDGNVGIGTTSPESRLHIAQSNAGGKVTLYIDNDASSTLNNEATIKFSVDSGASATVGGAEISTINVNASNGNSDLTFKTFNASSGLTEKVRITSGGNVGIGTTTPGAKLDVRGTSYFRGSALGVTIDPSATGANMYFYEGGNPVIYLQSSGSTIFNNGFNVGIGTTSPSYKLSINGSAGIEANEEYFYFHSTYSVGSNARAKIRAVGAGGGSGYGGDFRISTRATNNTWNEDAVTVNYAGNVGIGTTSPGYKLDIQSGSANFRYDQPSSTSYTYFRNWASGGSVALLLGASDSDDSNAEIIFSNNTLYLQSYGDPGSSIQFGTRNNSTSAIRMKIDQDGNVGIGTTSPSYRLQVSGSIAVENQGTTTIESTTFSGTLTSNTNIAFVPTGSFKAAFFDYYVASSSTNMRAGTVMAVHNNSTSRYTDTSTADIGNTSAVDFSTSVVGGNLVLTANISSGTWEIKTAYRAL